MDPVRVGRSLRALRIRRRLTQAALAARVGVSRTTVARLERGHADRVTHRLLAKVATELDATISVRVLWRGEALDRLLDAAHAGLTEAVLRLLNDAGWEVATEVSFNEFGDRGVIDVLAFHRETGSLVVIEIKSVVPDLQAMLGTLDRKVRVSGMLARARGWRPTTTSRLLVLPDDRTARRRVAGHATTFAVVLPERTAAVRRWLKRPSGPIAGILFLSDVPQAHTRHRVGRRRRAGPA